MFISIVLKSFTIVNLKNAFDIAVPSDSYTFAVILDELPARELFDALIMGFGAISPQPSELAGKAMDDMEAMRDYTALTKLRDEATRRLNAIGIE